MPTIHFNGKTYNDLAEMPATEREMYDQLMAVMVDEDGDGIPDILEGDVVSNLIEVMKKSGYGDSEGVSTLEQISPKMRERLSKGVELLSKFGLLSEITDLPHTSQIPRSRSTPTWEDAEIRPSKPILTPPSTIQEETGASRVLIIFVVMVGLLACGIGAALLFYAELGL